MKISDDERREIAARLRSLDVHDWNDFMDEIDSLETAIGCSIGQDWQDQHWWERLANLIEPEPERTCRMTKKGPESVLAGWWKCSECGPVCPPCNDEIALWALQKCPRCGARVMWNE